MVKKNILNKTFIVLMFILALVTLVLTYQFIIESNNNSKSLISEVEKLEKQEKRQLEIIKDLEIQERLQNQIITKLESKERFQVEVWADAIKKINNPKLSGERRAVLIEIIEKAGSGIQAIVLDQDANYENASSNFKEKQRLKKDKNYLDSLIFIMKSQNNPIEIDWEITQIDSQNNLQFNPDGSEKKIKVVQYIYYKDSEILDAIDEMSIESKALSESVLSINNNSQGLSESIKGINDNYNKSSNKLKYLPIVIFIISLFLFLSAYYIFYYSQKSAQNKLWVGMAKETAHQIGTPLSSLVGWLDYFKTKKIQSNIIDEIKKDTDRLGQIANRFSKIGSQPTPELVEIIPIVNKTIDYMKKRASKNIQFKLMFSDKIQGLKTNICVELFVWVTENILKNSIDSIQTEGLITISVIKKKELIILDFSDNGKGILSSNYKNIFEPGYTSKKRGWGLGLSLSKRIIKDYHEGRIFVHKSTPFKETIIRIILKS